MKISVNPILSEIKELYSQPRSKDRFSKYLAKLQGNTQNDMALPISGFNPMAKDHILSKVEELLSIQAEEIISEVVQSKNKDLAQFEKENFVLVLNLADDVKGGWTNRYSADFDSKFKLSGIASRRFIVPYFWASETYDRDLIIRRTNEYIYRTIYWISHPRPITLRDHYLQELFVNKHVGAADSSIDLSHLRNTKEYFEVHKDTDHYDKLIHFFYGSPGSQSLGLQDYGLKESTGFQMAAHDANL